MERPALKHPFLERPGSELDLYVWDIKHTWGLDPQVLLYCLTREGNTVTVQVENFVNYFYMVPLRNCHVQDAAGVLDRELEKHGWTPWEPRWYERKRLQELGRGWVEQVVEVEKQSFIGTNPAGTFWKVFVNHHNVASSVHELSMRGALEDGAYGQYTTWEADVSLTDRFSLDTGVCGCKWVTVQRNEVTEFVREGEDRRLSTAQLEFVIDFRRLRAHADPFDERWAEPAPLRILSFDIECAGHDENKFPRATLLEDPVVTVCYQVVQTRGGGAGYQVLQTGAISYGECGALLGTEGAAVVVYSEADEAALFRRFKRVLDEADADVITGYNIVGFDWRYLLDRCQTLEAERDQVGLLDEFSALGRRTEQRCHMKRFEIVRRGEGVRIRWELQMDGRVVLDPLPEIRKDHKLSSYTLNNVSHVFLGDQKEDVHHSQITRLWRGSVAERTRLTSYCVKDAVLPVKLIFHPKLNLLATRVALSRVIGIPIFNILFRGQTNRVFMQIMQQLPAANMINPTRDEQNVEEMGYSGGYVAEPNTAGFYEQPIITLDFNSLYPNIMRANNLSYDTYVPANERHRFHADQMTLTPAGHTFLTRDVREGVLPKLEHILLTARAQVKRRMKEVDSESDVWVQLNAQQLAIKVCANSVYGFTGATVSRMPLKALSESVTAYGRHMIQDAGHKVEVWYPGAVIRYGDTDSIFIDLSQLTAAEPVRTVAQAIEWGTANAPLITKRIWGDKPEINLAFEKVICPWLIIAKKRYGGIRWLRADAPEPGLYMSGIETVRRDWCPLVTEVLNRTMELCFRGRRDEVADYVRGVVRDVYLNQVPFAKYIINKNYSKEAAEYKNPQAHVQVVKKMSKRLGEDSAPGVGDRVPFVVITDTSTKKMCDLAEEPLYALTHGIPLNTQYYVHKQLEQPVCRLLRFILPNPKQLFYGEHTMKRARPVETNSMAARRGGALGALRRQVACPGCFAPMDSRRLTCRECRAAGEPHVQVRYEEHEQHIQQARQRAQEAWDVCRQCMGSDDIEELRSCNARDCANFYHRCEHDHRLQALLEKQTD